MYFVKMLWHKLYADREPFLLWSGNKEAKVFLSDARQPEVEVPFFSFLYTSKLTNLSLLSVFILIMRHDLPENLGKTTAQEYNSLCFRLSASLNSTLGFVPGFASAPHCDVLNVTRVKIEFYQKNQAEFNFEARGTTCSWLLVAGDGHLVLKRKTTEEQWRSCVIASHSIESFIKLTSF